MKQNPALNVAVDYAEKHHLPVAVVFTLSSNYLGATWRQYDFMFKGLMELEKDLAQKNIPLFVLSHESPVEAVRVFVKKHQVGLLVTDFSPLKPNLIWQTEVANKIDVACWQVDAHNIVPAWTVSSKQEYAARTFRPKILRLMSEYSKPLASIKKLSINWPDARPVNWQKATRAIVVDKTVPPVMILSGELAANKCLRDFVKHRLAGYANQRNNPVLKGQSELSPYLHFGQLGAWAVVEAVDKASAPQADKAAFLEEFVVRRELADNYCLYNPDYDSLSGAPEWAKKTLLKHQKDKRNPQYTLSQLEKAQTKDDLWNAAQMEMVKTGKMHGYLRMYWAKKILEWSKTPAVSYKHAIYLNDKYELDGRDPNGYAGVAWSIAGVHDRPWFERPVFGMVRYMSYNGMKNKFDVKKYIENINKL